MDEGELLAARFEANRSRLQATAYRMLGSLSEAEDAVQEAWIHLSRSDADSIGNLDGWLTTVVARICLNVLRSRKSRREEPFSVHVPDPIVAPADGIDPEREAVLADSIGLALLVVLERLTPAERVAFVLHDVFDLPFEEVGPIVGRSSAAARQLASRARRRVQGSATESDADLPRQRQIVTAFLAAARGGDFRALLTVLDPEVVLRADAGVVAAGASREIRGAEAVAEGAINFARRFSGAVQPALVNGAAGLVGWTPDGRPVSVMGFTVAREKIVEIDILVDAARLQGLGLRASPEAQPPPSPPTANDR